jgi:hypothetical protein
MRKKSNLNSGKGLPLKSLVWMAGWLIVFLPWIYTSEYYLLPFTAGSAFFAGIMIEGLLKDIVQNHFSPMVPIFLISVVFLLLIATIPTNYSNARIQLAVDKVNANLIQFVAENVPTNSTLLVNFPKKHEYIREISLHLSEIYHRSNIDVSQYEEKNLQSDLDYYDEIYLVENEVRNTVPLSVRLGIYESESRDRSRSSENVRTKYGKVVYSIEKTFPIFYINSTTMLCPGFTIPMLCTTEEPILNKKYFSYGWTVYQLQKEKNK